MERTILVITALLLAGCASSDAPTDLASDPSAEGAPASAEGDPTVGPEGSAPLAITTTSFDGSIQAGFWFGGAVGRSYGETAPVAFEVPAQANGAIVEVAWDEGQGNAVDLDLVVTMPDATSIEMTEGAPGDEGPIALWLTDDRHQVGGHSFSIRCKACVSQAFHVYVSTFEGAGPDASFSAIPS